MILKLLLSLLSFSMVDYRCLSEAIYYEAGNQSIEGMVSVSNVISNRVKDRRWSDSFCEVIYQPNQFSYYWDGKPEHMPKRDNTLEHIAMWKSRAVATWELLTDIDITNGSLYYHNTKIEPPIWTTRVTQNSQVGDHILYTD